MEAVPPALPSNVAPVPAATVPEMAQSVPTVADSRFQFHPAAMLPAEAQVFAGVVAPPALMTLPMAEPAALAAPVPAMTAVVPATASAVVPAAAITAISAAAMPMAVVATVAQEVGQTSVVAELADDAGAAKRGRSSGAKVPRWTSEEDERLKALVAEKGERAWKEVAAGLEHGRSATAVEQHYNILVGKRKKPGAKEDGEEEDAPDDADKVERARLQNEQQAKKQEDKEERAAAKRAEKEARTAEKEAKAAGKEAEKAAAKEKRDREAAERQAKKDMPKKPRTRCVRHLPRHCLQRVDGAHA